MLVQSQLFPELRTVQVCCRPRPGLAWSCSPASGAIPTQASPALVRAELCSIRMAAGGLTSTLEALQEV